MAYANRITPCTSDTSPYQADTIPVSSIYFNYIMVYANRITPRTCPSYPILSPVSELIQFNIIWVTLTAYTRAPAQTKYSAKIFRAIIWWILNVLTPLPIFLYPVVSQNNPHPVTSLKVMFDVMFKIFNINYFFSIHYVNMPRLLIQSNINCLVL